MERLAALAQATVRRALSITRAAVRRTKAAGGSVLFGPLAVLAGLLVSPADTIATFGTQPMLATEAPVEFVRLLSGVVRPASVAIAPDGRIIVTDNVNRQAKVFLSTGGETVLLPAAREAEEPESSPLGVAVDEDGQTYVSDAIRKEVLVYRLGDPIPRPFAGPEWGARVPAALFARAGLLYVTDIAQHQVVVIDIAQERRIAVIGSGQGDGPGELRYPNGIWVNLDGVIYVSDTNNDRIQRFGADGAVMPSWYGPFRNPRGLAGDAAGRLFVANTLAHEVLVIDRSGQAVARVDRAGKRELGFPTGLAVTRDRLLVTDRDAQGVFEWRLTEGRRDP